MTQVKLTDFLSLTSEANTQPSDRNKGVDVSPPITKKAKHQESGFDPSWKDEFTWSRTKKAQAWFALSVASTIRQLKGWFG